MRTHILILERSLSQIPLPKTGLTPPTAGASRPGSDSQKNITRNVSSSCSLSFLMILRNSDFASGGTISSRHRGRWTGKGFFSGTNSRHTCARTHPHNTHANENHIILRKSSLWLASWSCLKPEEAGGRRGQTTQLTVSRSTNSTGLQHHSIVRPLKPS